METQRQEARRDLEDRYEVRLAGEGGQGMILAGVILAEAAAVHDDLNAVQTQSYGPEARGGASRSEVVIARGEIDYPKVMSADFLLCMSQEACDKFYTQVKEDGWILVDSGHVSRMPSHRALRVAVSQIAEEATGRRITASMVGLGLIGGLSGVVSRAALEKAVADRVPAGTEEINLKALAAGFAEAERIRRARDRDF
ncbi:MAG: 2-oxoacid:acceptor oxidoreductase family protein [Anaerolineae bacterium]|jgi:2-oxoglutarate ferredoxin oxidoreductase subunit gamma|nr:2-oxoacid:acceptor oxidoreductase family protein [Anaerolineae bacterium]